MFQTRIPLIAAALGLLTSTAFAAPAEPSHQGNMVRVEAGEFRPLYLKPDADMEKVPSFLMDTHPVTNGEFFQFVQRQSEWRKENIKVLFAEDSYLSHWSRQENQWQPAPDSTHAPVNNVSWFAAQAYCEDQGKQLPTTSQWEYASGASDTEPRGNKDPEYNQRILRWYSRPTATTLPEVGKNPPNYWGIHDLHGLTWEWTDDFNSAMSIEKYRAGGGDDNKLFCAAGSADTADPGDYAAFMRFGFRSSLQAKFTLPNLGFRCAKQEITDENIHSG